MKKALFKAILFIVFLAAISCSKDDEGHACRKTHMVMTINGQEQFFQSGGRGIMLKQSGYELSVSVQNATVEPPTSKYITLILPYKKTGKNIIQNFYYTYNTNEGGLMGDFVEGQLESHVLKNTKDCFYATFSGKLIQDGQEIIIENGMISYEYENPFDN